MSKGKWIMPVLASLLLLAGCAAKTPAPSATGTATPEAKPAPTAPATPSTPTAPRAKVSMAIGGAKNSMIFLVPVFAQANNDFENQNLELDLVETKGGSQAAQALVSGQVDFASLSMEHAIKAKAQGVDVVMLDIYTLVPTVTIVVDSKYNVQVKSPADLKGMKIGITSPGSGSHQALLSLLAKFGVKATDVEIIGVGTATMPEALTSGKVQAAANYDPFITQVTSKGAAYVLWDLRTMKDTKELYGSEYPFVGLATRRDVIEKNPELVQRVVNAHLAAQRFMTSNSAEMIASKLSTEVKGSDEALYVAALKLNLEALSRDGKASTVGLQKVIDNLKADGAIPAATVITPEQVLDAQYIAKASK